MFDQCDMVGDLLFEGAADFFALIGLPLRIGLDV
jgi:hypothetical protein